MYILDQPFLDLCHIYLSVGQVAQENITKTHIPVSQTDGNKTVCYCLCTRVYMHKRIDMFVFLRNRPLDGLSVCKIYPYVGFISSTMLVVFNENSTRKCDQR